MDRTAGKLLMARLLMALLVASATACKPADGVRQCTTSAECDLEASGSCSVSPEGGRWCSYPAADCPSGSRWSRFAGDSLAGGCVASPDGGTTPDGASEYSLSVGGTGDGSGTVTSTPAGIDCGANCSAPFSTGTMVELMAVPEAGSVFAGWAGDCTDTVACVVTMDQPRAVTATFLANRLTVTLTGTGDGTVTSDPSGINCGGVCSSVFAAGTSLGLTATPAGGSSFLGWSGGCAGVAPCTLSLDGPMSIGATFNLQGEYASGARLGGTGYEVASEIVVDAAGNQLVAGMFNGTINLGGADLTSSGNEAFVAKFSSAGAHLWSKRLGATLLGLGVTPGGDVALAGSFAGTVDFGGGMVSSDGPTDVFLVMLSSSDGAYVWSHTAGGPSSDTATGLAVDGTGLVSVVGKFQTTGVTVDFGGLALGSSGTGSDYFIVQYSATGVIQSAKRFGTTADDVAHPAVVTDSAGETTIVGAFSGILDYPMTSSLVSTGNSDAFVIHRSSAGAVVWSRRFGVSGASNRATTATAAPGAVVVAGRLEGAVDFGCPTIGAGNVFVAALSTTDGSCQWMRAAGGSSNLVQPNAMAVDTSGRLVVTGFTVDTATDFGDGPMVRPGGQGDGFVVSYWVGDGGFRWARLIGSGTDTLSDTANAVALDDAGHIFVAGGVEGVVDFGGGAVPGLGSQDIFIAEYGP